MCIHSLITKMYKDINIKKFSFRRNIFDRGICSDNEFVKEFFLKIVLISLLEHVFNAPLMCHLKIYSVSTISRHSV